MPTSDQREAAMTSSLAFAKIANEHPYRVLADSVKLVAAMMNELHTNADPTEPVEVQIDQAYESEAVQKEAKPWR